MLPVERGVPILNAKVSSDPFLETCERVAMEATRKLFELRVKDPTSNWREHQMVAEIYHGLRDCGVNFDDLNLEAQERGRAAISTCTMPLGPWLFRWSHTRLRFTRNF